MATSGSDNAFPAFPTLPGEHTEKKEGGLTKREYFAVHLFEAVVSRLSVNCTLQDKAKYAVEAADALVKALGTEE